jgi:hypothetical protein
MPKIRRCGGKVGRAHGWARAPADYNFINVSTTTTSTAITIRINNLSMLLHRLRSTPAPSHPLMIVSRFANRTRAWAKVDF